jgi:hypothetical protein
VPRLRLLPATEPRLSRTSPSPLPPRAGASRTAATGAALIRRRTATIPLHAAVKVEAAAAIGTELRPMPATRATTAPAATAAAAVDIRARSSTCGNPSRNHAQATADIAVRPATTAATAMAVPALVDRIVRRAAEAVGIPAAEGTTNSPRNEIVFCVG